jgi:hypothetical protein
MDKTRILALVIAIFLLAPQGQGQEPPGNIGRVYFIKVKVGTVAQFENEQKRHVTWHRERGDLWAWHTWQIETGDRSGQYVLASFGRRWKDFDTWAKTEEGHSRTDGLDLDQHLENSSNTFYEYIADVSRPPRKSGPSPKAEVISFHLYSNEIDLFTEVIKKLYEAAMKIDFPTSYYWYKLVNGGEHPTYVLEIPVEGWGDVRPPEEIFEMVFEKALGKGEGAAMLRSLRKSVQQEISEVFRYRPDLSYTPMPK